MTEKNDGGLAFPSDHLIQEFSEGECFSDSEKERLIKMVAGMSLRDYFAAKAMQKYSPRPSDETNIGWASMDFSEAARLAYAYADAMLTARQEKAE